MDSQTMNPTITVVSHANCPDGACATNIFRYAVAHKLELGENRWLKYTPLAHDKLHLAFEESRIAVYIDTCPAYVAPDCSVLIIDHHGPVMKQLIKAYPDIKFVSDIRDWDYLSPGITMLDTSETPTACASTLMMQQLQIIDSAGVDNDLLQQVGIIQAIDVQTRPLLDDEQAFKAMFADHVKFGYESMEDAIDEFRDDHVAFLAQGNDYFGPAIELTRDTFKPHYADCRPSPTVIAIRLDLCDYNIQPFIVNTMMRLELEYPGNRLVFVMIYRNKENILQISLKRNNPFINLATLALMSLEPLQERMQSAGFFTTGGHAFAAGISAHSEFDIEEARLVIEQMVGPAIEQGVISQTV